MSKLSRVALGAALVFAATAAVALEVQRSGEATYVSGGIGVDERAALEALQPDFNLKLVAAGTDGHYLAGVDVTVSRPGGAVVLETRMAGPWLLARLPDGEYEVRASFDGTPRAQRVEIAAGKLITVQLRW